MFDKIPTELREALPGAIGSAVAMRWIGGPWWWRIVAFVGAAYVAWLAAAPLADLLGLSVRWVGVVGFAIGLLIISFAIKAVDTVHAIQPSEIWNTIVEAIRRRLGL